jgi:hypothetical protein
MIVNGEVHYTRLEDLNDPFDLNWCERLPVEEEERDRFARELCAKTFPYDTPAQRRYHFANMMNQIRELTTGARAGVIRSVTKIKYGVLCLSAINDDVLMWSHYADHHKGVCVGIRSDRLTNKRILHVRYSDDVPVIDCWSYVHHDREEFVNASRSKGLHWKYEEEWRTVDDPGPRQYPSCVDSVVIGAKADSKTRAAVFEAAAAAEHGIKVYEARVHSTRYALEILPASKSS